MKAPDKICIRKDDTAPFGFTRHWIYTTKVQEHDIEYIRKDALLEWAEARKTGLTSGESFVAGERKMLKEIIDKLNSI